MTMPVPRVGEAVRKRQQPEVERLVQEPLCDVNCRDKEHNTPLHWAAVQGDVPILRLLLGRRDLDVNRQTKQKAFSPLHLAARHGHAEAVSLLMRHPKLEVNIFSASREAPIHAAAHKGHSAVVKLLAGHAAADPSVVAEAMEKLQNPSPRKAKHGTDA